MSAVVPCHYVVSNIYHSATCNVEIRVCIICAIVCILWEGLVHVCMCLCVHVLNVLTCNNHIQLYMYQITLYYTIELLYKLVHNTCFSEKIIYLI